LLRSIPHDHLVFSSPEAETWTFLQSCTGLAILLAAAAIVRGNTQRVRGVAWAIAGSGAVLAAATIADVTRQWAAAGYTGGFLLRYVEGERFSLHLADVNAAGSFYVLAAVAAAAFGLFHREHRSRAIGLMALMGPALWLTGSRSAVVALVIGLVIVASGRTRWSLARRPTIAVPVVAALVLVLAMLTVDWQSEVKGSVGKAADLRSQFSVTSARMLASAPVFGVGVGRYFERSSEFMPAELRAIYGNENAHNYFAQQFVELGIVGGLLFAWLAAAGVARAWVVSRASGDAASLGLFAGTTAYLSTCLTGHPLLVPEAALPFWAAFGAVAGGHNDDAEASKVTRVLAAAACVFLAICIGRAVVSYTRARVPPADAGFHGMETAADGTRFRWMTRHALTTVPAEPGFMRLRLRAPDYPLTRPLVVQTAFAGRVVDRREIPSGRWITYDVPARGPVRTPFRRVDLRVNQLWTQEVTLGQRPARRPVTVMVGALEWIPLR
jgi:hypothetical protein